MFKFFRYLLAEGFHYILTRKLNSDSIEALFGSLRQCQGSNDQIDARGVLNSLENTIKLGMVSAADQSNVQSTSKVKAIFASLSSKVSSHPEFQPCSNTISLLNLMKNPSGT